MDGFNKKLGEMWDWLNNLSGGSVLKEFNKDWIEFVRRSPAVISRLSSINSGFGGIHTNLEKVNNLSKMTGGGPAPMPITGIRGGGGTTITTNTENIAPNIHIHTSPMDPKDKRMKEYLKQAMVDAVRGG